MIAVLFVDGVDRPVLAPAGAPEGVQRRVKLLPEPLGIPGDGPGEVLNTAVAADSGSRLMPRRAARVKTTS